MSRRFHTGIVAVLIIGLAAIVLYAPRARAAIEALTEPGSPRTHQLWVCEGATTCKPRGALTGKTDCELDAAALASTVDKATKIACRRVK